MQLFINNMTCFWGVSVRTETVAITNTRAVTQVQFRAHTHLDADLRQVDLQRQLLSAVHVRVVGLLEGSLQLVKLEGGERGPVPAVFLLRVLVVGQFAVSVR